VISIRQFLVAFNSRLPEALNSGGAGCPTRVIAGVGVPQLSAIFEVSQVNRRRF